MADVPSPPTPVPATPAAPPPPKLVKLKIDGVDVEAKAGTNLIEAARKAGITIPYYCYHPRLTIAANCRMCLVQSSNAPKLVPGCQTPVAEGIEVSTKSPQVRESQRAVLEMILLNHPVDCSICDQAGECKLEDYYMMFDFKPSRLEGGKVLKNKRKVLGPLVVLDQERCILCTRCVRFMEEVPKERQLGAFGRGSHEFIDIFPGKPLDSNYAGNTVDICPVGALLSRDFRFKARTWFLSATPSICTGCSRGCNIFADWYNGTTYRYRPRECEEVNKSWMCDQGRLSYKHVNTDRVEVARLGKKAEGQAATAEQAARQAAEKLKPLAKTEQLAVLASPLASVEDLLAWMPLVRDGLGAKKIYLGGRAEGAADHLLMTADKNPNCKGLGWVAAASGLTIEPFSELVTAVKAGKVKAVLALGAEIPAGARDTAVLFSQLELFVALSRNQDALTDEAHILLPASTHLEDHGTFVNLDGRAQRFVRAYPPVGEARPLWAWAGSIGQHLGVDLGFKLAQEVFAKLAPTVPELASFDWVRSAPRSVSHKGSIVPLPAAGDGRPAGYREWMEDR